MFLTAEALPSPKNIRECRNPAQLPRASSHLLYTYYIFNRIPQIFIPSLWKYRGREGKKASQDHQAGQQLARPDGKTEDELEKQDLAFG